MTIQLELNDEQAEALAEAMNLAFNHQRRYLSIGEPALDYDDEWPTVANEKAAGFRHLAAIVEQLGWTNDAANWNALADNFEASGREYKNPEVGN